MDKLLSADAPQQCAALAFGAWQRKAVESAVAYDDWNDGELPYGRSARKF